MKQSDIFVLDECEITVDKKIYSEHEVDLQNLRKSKSVTLCPALLLNKLILLSLHHLLSTLLCFSCQLLDWQMFVDAV